MERRYETHMFTYRHDGAEWTLMLKATNAEDARARIGKLAYASYDGVVSSQSPAIMAPIGILSVWVQNLARQLISRFGR